MRFESKRALLHLLQESPELAPFLGEAFDGTSPTIAAQRPPGAATAAAAASDMLTLGFEDELTEEEELVSPATFHACLMHAYLLTTPLEA